MALRAKRAKSGTKPATAEPKRPRLMQELPPANPERGVELSDSEAGDGSDEDSDLFRDLFEEEAEEEDAGEHEAAASDSGPSKKKKQASVSFAGKAQAAAPDQPFVGIWSAFDSAAKLSSKKVDRETKAFLKEVGEGSADADAKAKAKQDAKVNINPESALADMVMNAPAEPRLKRRALASALHKIR